MRPFFPARLLFAILLSLSLLPLVATADADGGTEKEALPLSDLSFPESEKQFSATQKCVQPIAEMRRNHMRYLYHQRNETMHQGIRTRRYSLRGCINCHTAKDDQGEYIPINGPDQFCSSCHSYASVNIDCFQCHATQPARTSMLQLLPSSSAQGADGMINSTLQQLAPEGQAK